MPQRIEAFVQPPLLVWARETAGFDVETAAKKAGIKPERLGSWESGTTRPTMGQARELARIYKRPIAVFYLPQPPPDVRAPTDFRRLPGEVAGVESPELRYEVRRAVNRRQIALDLLTEEREEPPPFHLPEATLAADEMGTFLRGATRIDLELQYSWRGTHEAFNGWRRAIEQMGALVLQMTDVEMSEARGFSIAELPLPAVVTNIKDAPNGRVFTLLHELAHVVLRQGGLCDLDDTSRRSPELLRIEQFCNQVAGVTLVPREPLLVRPEVQAHGPRPEWSDAEIQNLARQFAVSREVILRRLLDLKRTTLEFYAAKREQFLREYLDRRGSRETGFAPPHQVALASAGPTFTGLVLSSYADGYITASDVSDYLGIRVKHIPGVEQQLLASARSG